MLTAYDDQGKPVVLYRYSREEIKRLKSRSFFCPVCQENVYIRAGDQVIPHFAHFQNSACTERKGEGEKHRQGKIDLMNWLTEQDIPAVLEYYLPRIQQRADILVKWRNRWFALEYQCSSISREMLIKRTRSYQRMGITPIWISGKKRRSTSKASKINLTHYERFFFYEWDARFPPVLYFYNPEDKAILMLQQPYPVKSSFYGTLRRYPLSRISFSHLFQVERQPDSWIYSSWLNEKIKFRTYRSRFFSHDDHEFRQWLYQLGYHPQHLPSAIHLPTPHHFYIKPPPYIWQSKIVLLFLHPMPVGSVFSIKQLSHVMNRHNSFSTDLPFVLRSPTPVEEYLHLLCKCGYFDQIGPDRFRKVRNFTFFKTLEQAFDGDKTLIKFLLSCSSNTSPHCRRR